MNIFFCKRKNTTFYNCCYFTWPSSSLFIAYPPKHSSHLSRQHFVILISSVTVKSNCQLTCVKACQLYSKMISQESWHLSEHLFYTHSCLIIYPRIRHIYSAPIYARVTRSARLGLASLASDLDTVWHHFIPKSWYVLYLIDRKALIKQYH